MIALVLCTAAAAQVAAQDPVVTVQLKYPVNRVVITSGTGSNVYYTVPSDAPLELRRAVKVLEIAERDVLIADALQLLKLEIVQNERKLESLRADFNAAALRPTPANGFGNAGPDSQAGRYYMPSPSLVPDSPMRAFLTGTLAADATTERMVFAIDRLAEAQIQLQKVWIDLAFPDVRAGRAAGGNAAKRPVPGPRFPTAPALRLIAHRVTFDEACQLTNDLAAADKTAQKRVTDADKAVDALFAKLRAAPAAERAAVRAEIEAARNLLDATKTEAAEVRKRWKTASTLLVELTGDNPELRPSSSPGRKPTP